MSQVCSKCSHVNPADASYCYYDGQALAGHKSNGGPVNAGSVPFPSQFVFPTGQACRNFDQLAMACQQNWSAAVDLLKQGYLASFLGGLGRIDLAMAAQEAARYPDQDRGLDQLLEKLPTQVLQKPRLVAEPSELNLGRIEVGSDRQFELHLANKGMRLLYGSVVSDSKWLTLGEAPGNAQKLFSFGNDGAIAVQVRGQHLRAGNKPLEGHLIVESNGGQASITVRVDVPVRPFREGVLAGAISPRQVAEKAKAQPKESAPLFEHGAVAAWFKENGWTYPVQGPSASGLGAVQQFFEALGLATAPKVEVTEKSVSLRGNVGQPLQATIEIKTQEKRPVYAHATTDQPWLDVSKTTLNGRVAIVNLTVHSVPNRPGEVLQANVHITANGNQRFAVPVNLTITGMAVYPMSPPAVLTVEPVMAQLYGAQPYGAQPVMALPVMAQPVMALPVMAMPAQPAPGMPFVTAQSVQALPVSPQGVTAYSPAGPQIAVAATRPREEQRAPAWVHLTPAGALLFILLLVILRDVIRGGGVEVDPTAQVKYYMDDTSNDEHGKPLQGTMRFGVVALDPKQPGQSKKLTYDRFGRTNTTVVRINGEDCFFGAINGKWITRSASLGGRWGGTKSVWMFDDNVQVTQLIEVIPGEPVEVGDKFKRYLDTVLIRYEIENKDATPRKVGLRHMLDTMIGNNDGVPFTVPGLKGLVDSMHDFAAPDPVPDFAQVLERPDLKNPGLVGFINFKVGGGVEPPTRVSLTRWPGASRVWDVPMQPMGEDSAVVLYWAEREMKRGEVRKVGFSYGQSAPSSTSGQLGLTVGGNTKVGGELTVVALVSTPQKDQTLTLKLPPSFKFVEGEKATQPVPEGVANRASPVTWRIISSQVGNYDLEVTSSTGISQKKKVNIKTESIF